MAEKYLVVDGENYPLNLKELKKQDCNLTGYTVKPVYYLELNHGTSGFFPAIIKYPKKSLILISSDRDFILSIWQWLTPKNSGIEERMFYVHKSEKIGYPIKHDSLNDELAMGYYLFTEIQYFLEKEISFDWAPGFQGGSISHKEFFKAIELAKEKVLI